MDAGPAVTSSILVDEAVPPRVLALSEEAVSPDSLASFGEVVQREAEGLPVGEGSDKTPGAEAGLDGAVVEPVGLAELRPLTEEALWVTEVLDSTPAVAEADGTSLAA